MGILSTNKKIINLGQDYSAGNGISIDDYVISYTGNEGQLYNAGPNIDIYTDQDQLYISGKDWSADIANASSNAYEQATALIPPEFDPSYISGVVDSKLDATAFSTVSGDYATTSYVDMSDNLTYSRATAWGNQNLAPLNSVADNSAKWNEIEVYEQNSATYLTAHQDISNKLDTTAFSTVSGNFLTAHQVIPSAKWENASDVVQSNSAQWSENTGDEEVNNAVYNNSANWNDITVYQTNSANYLTAHQDLSYISGQVDNKLDTTAFSNVSGTFLTAHQDISNKLDTTAFSTVSGTFLTAHQDLSNYATTGDLNTTSGILSGAIDYLSGNAGKTYTGISPIVVNNDTNEISADSQDITFGEGLDFTNGVLTVTGGSESIDTIPVAVISPLVTGFSGESAYLGIESTALNLSSYVPVSAIGVNSYGYVSGISGMNISARIALTSNYAYTADRAYHDRNYNEITSYYQPKLNFVGDAGTITAINGSAVGATIPEGWELVAGQGIEIVDDSVNNQTTISVTAAGGNPEVESYVQTNSASIDDVVSTYEANSGNYLTAHQSLSDYYTTADANTLSGMLSGAIDYVSANAGSTITYDYTDNGLISAIDSSGLFAQGLLSGSHIGRNIVWDGGIGVSNASQMWLNPDQSHFAITSGIFSPLYYATGATITYGSSGSPAPNDGQIFGGFFKGNEWFVSNATAGQALRGETHQSRGVHISGATTAGTSFDLSINCVSGKNSTDNNWNWKLERGGVSGNGVLGSWHYGYAEDAALRNLSAQYDELKTSYDALSSLFATYSGQWLLPNQGE